MLTTEALVAEIPEKKEAHMGGGRGGGIDGMYKEQLLGLSHWFESNAHESGALFLEQSSRGSAAPWRDIIEVTGASVGQARSRCWRDIKRVDN